MAATRRLLILECLIFVIGHPSNDLPDTCTFWITLSPEAGAEGAEALDESANSANTHRQKEDKQNVWQNAGHKDFSIE
jgi:hypothetical protein